MHQECEALLKEQRDRFVEEELMADFGRLIAFVQQNERQADAAPLALEEQVVAVLVRDFAASWKQAIHRINGDILSLFTSFVNGMEILKHTLAQLLIWYKRFQDLLNQAFPPRGAQRPAFLKDLVNVEEIFGQIRTLSRNF